MSDTPTTSTPTGRARQTPSLDAASACLSDVQLNNLFLHIANSAQSPEKWEKARFRIYRRALEGLADIAFTHGGIPADPRDHERIEEIKQQLKGLRP